MNVFVSVTTQWTDLAPTFPDTQPEKSSEGSEVLPLTLGPGPLHSRVARCALYSDILYPSDFNDTVSHPAPTFST